MRLPPLDNWDTTSRVLHHATMLLVPIQKALVTRRGNYLHLAMDINEGGVSSLRLPMGGLIEVDFAQGSIVYHRGSGSSATLSFADHTQKTLFEALLAELQKDELSELLGGGERGSMADLLLTDKLDGFWPLDEVSHTDPLIYDRDEGRAYAEIQYGVFTGLARFRARLGGHMTPIVIWGEHFDLSTLWFHPANPEMDDYKAHINMGFAPFSAGFDRPYLYTYIYPYPDSFELPALPAGAEWHTDGWRGVVIRYDELVKKGELARYVESISRQVFDVLCPYLDQVEE